jgi:hypothetical protein
MISTGWSSLINEYVGSMSARPARLDPARLQQVRKFVPKRNRARQKAIL